ncbi:hypothetical protein HJFPF1_10669 [Paramyrothecium foliicola]|nr:hypothetical protein HJFPF1_10669 [Paramyrothecium foliicola]
MKVSVVIPMVLAGAMAAPVAQDAVEKIADVATMEGSNAIATANMQVAAPVSETVQDPATPVEGEVAKTQQKTVRPYQSNPLANSLGLTTSSSNPISFQGSLSDIILALLLSTRASTSSQSQQMPRPTPSSQTQTTPAQQAQATSSGTGPNGGGGGLVQGVGSLLETLLNAVSSLLGRTGSNLSDTLDAVQVGLGDLVDDIAPNTQG